MPIYNLKPMRMFVIVALLIFWIVLAVREFQHGDMLLGFVFVVVGIALTGYRLTRMRG